jgi:hypothetical protein
MAGTDDDFNTDDESFRLLRDEYQFAAELVGEKLAAKLARRFLEEGERDRNGRVRYKIWEFKALPGGAPSPYDGSFWRPDHARGIHCEIDYQSSSACWTGPASAEWKAFNGRQTAKYDVNMIRLCHDLFVEFLQSAGVPLQSEMTQPSESQTATAGEQSAQSGAPLGEAKSPPPSPLPTTEAPQEESTRAPAVSAVLPDDSEQILSVLGLSGFQQEAIAEAVLELYGRDPPESLTPGKLRKDLRTRHKAEVAKAKARGDAPPHEPAEWDACKNFVKALRALRAKQRLYAD